MSKKAIATNNYFVKEKDLKYVPPYFRDTAETPEEVECVLNGKWPEWLSGSLLRMGEGTYTVPLSEDGSKPNAVLQHFFDGLATLHKFRMNNGKVYYNSRHTHQGVLARAKKDGYLSATMFGPNANTPLFEAQDPCSTLYGAKQMMFWPQGHLAPDELNINVTLRRGVHLPPSTNPLDRGTPSKDPVKDELLVMTDFNALQVCDSKTLEPKRMLNYAAIDSELAGFGICAHPPKDRPRGHIYNYLIDGEKGILYVFALDYQSNPTKLLWKTGLPCKPCYIHSLAMTQDHVVFIRNPISMDVSDVTKPIIKMMAYETDSPTSFFVLDKKDGKLISQYDAKSFMFFHSVNAYEYTDGDDINIHVDLCSYDESTIPYTEYCLSNIADPAEPYSNGVLTRYELAGVKAQQKSGKTGEVRVVQAIPGTGMELPRIAKSASMNPSYRYVYATGGNGESAPGSLVPIGRLGNGMKVVQSAFFNSIAKTDWETGTFKKWKPTGGESCPCEPIFVARPGATEEDDGVVLTIVCSKKGDHSVLVALDAKNMKEIARADLPQVYGMGPHGTYVEVPDTSLPLHTNGSNDVQ